MNTRLIKLFFIFFAVNTNAQSILNFNKQKVECEDKWVAFQQDKDSTHIFGFVFSNGEKELRLHYEGKFKIDKEGRFVKETEDAALDKKTKSIELLNLSNEELFAEIPETKFIELGIVKVPNWLESHKKSENYVENTAMHKIYNEHNYSTENLHKTIKKRPVFKGIDVEYGFSNNEKLTKNSSSTSIKNDENECDNLNNIANAYITLKLFDKAKKTYNDMVSTCENEDLKGETAYNLAYEFYLLNNKSSFNYWKEECLKWFKKPNKFTESLIIMQAGLK